MTPANKYLKFSRTKLAIFNELNHSKLKMLSSQKIEILTAKYILNHSFCCATNHLLVHMYFLWRLWLIRYRSDDIRMDVGIPAKIYERLELAVSIGERKCLSRHQIEGTKSRPKYYWSRASGNSTTPPKKSVKFWYRMKDCTPEKTVNGNFSKTC